MNDESIRSDDLFKSGIYSGFSDFTTGRTDFQNGNLVDGYPEPRLHLLCARDQEDDDTQVKDIDLNSLADSFEHLSIDGDDYAEVHLHNDCAENFLKTDVNGAQEHCADNFFQKENENTVKSSFDRNNDTAQKPKFDKKTVISLANKQLLPNKYVNDRASPFLKQNATEECEGNSRDILEPIIQDRISDSGLPLANFAGSCQELTGQKPVEVLAQHLPGHNMAESSQSHQNSTLENGLGARLKVRGTNKNKPKTKKQTKAANSNSSQIPKAPFKLQHKRYDKELEESDGISVAAEGHAGESDISSFPVEYLNPYIDPKTIQTIRPGVDNSAELLSGFMQADNAFPKGQVVRPKLGVSITEGSSACAGRLRHNNSDPVIHKAGRQVTDRNSADLSSLALNVEDSCTDERNMSVNQAVRLKAQGAATDAALGVFDGQDDRRFPNIKLPNIKQVVPTKAKKNSNVSTASKTEETTAKPQVNEKNIEHRTEDNDNMNILIVRQESSSSPQRIEYINNLDTCTTKKIENKDMKNTNRSRNLERNPNICITNAGCSGVQSTESVQTTQPLQYQNLDHVIDLEHVSSHNPTNSPNIVGRLKKKNNTNAETNTIVVPYQAEISPVSVLPSFDESLQSNILFGDGTEVNDHMLAKMLQEQYDKEHEEICRRNQFDIAPETLRLHNLVPNLNMADGESGGQSLFGEILQPNSLYQNDVYETSPRSDGSEHNQYRVTNNSPEPDNDMLYPNSVAKNDQNRVDNEECELRHDELYPSSIMQDSINEPETYYNDLPYPVLIPVSRETDHFGESQFENLETEENTNNTVYIPYETEHHREVLPPETPDEGSVCVHAERIEDHAGRSDEDYALSLQRRLMMEEQEYLDEELARQLEEEEEERQRDNGYRSRFGGGTRYSTAQQPLHSRYSMWNRRPLHVRQEPARYSENIRIQNTWDRPLRQANTYNSRARGPFGRPYREGYDIYGNEYEPDLMPDQYGEEDFVSITRDPHLLATMLMDRAPNMMVPDNIDMDDYEALWDLAENLGEVRRVGMDEQEISLLPVHTYQAPTGAEGGDSESGDCRVCLTDFKAGERLRTLPCCHIYHVDCIDEWLKRNAVCPVCRQSARQ